MRIRPSLFSAALLSSLLSPGLAAEEPDRQARRELEELGIPFTTSASFEGIQADDLPTVQLLLDAGMDPNSKDDELDTALLRAAQRGNLDMVSLLLTRGANPDDRDNEKE